MTEKYGPWWASIVGIEGHFTSIFDPVDATLLYVHIPIHGKTMQVLLYQDCEQTDVPA